MSIQLSSKRLKNHHMLSDLPSDLESEILSRVPADSLENLKTTCKRWHSLVAKNLEKAAAAKEAKILLMSFGVYSISVDLHDPSMEFTGKLKCLQDDLKISQIFHCNGLILCSTKNETKLFVWNPCTGETLSVKPRNRYKDCDKYALGYGEGKSAYKILRSCVYYKKTLGNLVVEFEIYDFNSDSWKVLQDKWKISFDGVSLKGNAYWIALDIEAVYVCYRTLLYFDFTTERFVSFPLPYQCDYDEDNVALSVFREEKIALLHQRFFDGLSIKTTVWLTNKMDEGCCKQVCWSKFFVVDLEKFKLSRIESVITFLLDDDEENKRAVCCSRGMMEDESYVYILGEDLHKEVYREKTQRSWCSGPRLLNYVPSLVRIQQNIPQGKA